MIRLLRRNVAVAALIPLMAAMASQATEAAEYRLTFGGEYSTGDYGASRDTTIWYFPVSLQRRTETTALSVTVPYLIVRGPGVVLPGTGGGRVVRKAPVTSSKTEEGLGDVLLSGSYRLVSEVGNRPRIDLTGKIKLGTADEDENLGTGETDAAVQVDLEKGDSRNLLFGSVGYWVFGDPPGINLKNAFYGSIGLSHRLDESRNAGAILHAQESVTSGGPGALDVSGFLTNRITKNARLQVYGLVGLADGSPDWGLGAFLILSR